jgi:hypothetical protein
MKKHKIRIPVQVQVGEGSARGWVEEAFTVHVEAETALEALDVLARELEELTLPNFSRAHTRSSPVDAA